jgi:hypothetical protein
MRKPAARIGAFVALLALVFAAAALAGSKIDPDVAESGAPHSSDGPAAHGETEAMPPGLAVSQDGYTLVPSRTRLVPDESARFAFSITGPGGETRHDFDVEHARRMHLIVVRRDLAAFQHVHPKQAEDGSWTAQIDTQLPGTYRVFADFSVDGAAITLATDVFVPGRFSPEPLPRTRTVADAGNGYQVALTADELRTGTNPVSFEVTRNGKPVGVQPYLGADGHLVALREHDLAFLHTHPEGEPGGGGPIEFEVSYPTQGAYRLFLQFRHRGEVHTAAFTQEVHDGGY